MDQRDKKFLEGLKQLPVREAEAILEFATREVRSESNQELGNIGQPFDETRKRIKKIEEEVARKLGPKAKLLQRKLRRTRKQKGKKGE